MSSSNNQCLNCDYQTQDNFCSNCGQSVSTHRYSIKHFFIHDFIHGIFHFDNGFFYTLKELFTRPGHSVREFIEGKRVKHFNYFAAVIIFLTINYFLSKWAKTELTEIFNKDSISGLLKINRDYSKFTTFLLIPVNALFSYFIFRKSKQNYTENLVLNIFLLAGTIALRIPIYIAMMTTTNLQIIRITNLIVAIFVFLYTAVFFYQYFSKYNFNRLQLFFKVFLISALMIITKQGVNNLINEIGIKFMH